MTPKERLAAAIERTVEAIAERHSGNEVARKSFIVPSISPKMAHAILAADPQLAADIEYGAKYRQSGLDAAWERAMATLPERWRPVMVMPTAPDEYDSEGHSVTGLFGAYTCSQSFFDGVTTDDAETAKGYGPTPTAALLALSETLEGAKS